MVWWRAGNSPIISDMVCSSRSFCLHFSTSSLLQHNIQANMLRWRRHLFRIFWLWQLSDVYTKERVYSLHLFFNGHYVIIIKSLYTRSKISYPALLTFLCKLSGDVQCRKQCMSKQSSSGSSYRTAANDKHLEGLSWSCVTYSDKDEFKPDWIWQKAKTPCQTGLLPQTKCSNGPLECHRDWPIPKMKFTERHPACLCEEKNLMNKRKGTNSKK